MSMYTKAHRMKTTTTDHFIHSGFARQVIPNICLLEQQHVQVVFGCKILIHHNAITKVYGQIKIN